MVYSNSGSQPLRSKSSQQLNKQIKEYIWYIKEGRNKMDFTLKPTASKPTNNNSESTTTKSNTDLRELEMNFNMMKKDDKRIGTVGSDKNVSLQSTTSANQNVNFSTIINP